MEDVSLVERIGNVAQISICTIPQGVLDAFEVDGLGDGAGYFIVERDLDGAIRQVLGKCVSYETASRLVELYRLSRKTAVPEPC